MRTVNSVLNNIMRFTLCMCVCVCNVYVWVCMCVFADGSKTIANGVYFYTMCPNVRGTPVTSKWRTAAVCGKTQMSISKEHVTTTVCRAVYTTSGIITAYDEIFTLIFTVYALKPNRIDKQTNNYAFFLPHYICLSLSIAV